MESIRVGKLDKVEFPAGWYLYTGSARGPGGVQSRLTRHRRRLGDRKSAHWHIDYLREQSVWGGAWARASDGCLECDWALTLRGLPGAKLVVWGFGASDCTCPGHLVYVPALPDDGWLATTLGANRITVRDDELDELLHTLATGDDERRESAALQLGRFGADTLEPLAAMLIEGDADDRWWAARTLAEIGVDGVVPLLVSALGDGDADVRACAALALGRVGGEAGATALAAQLDDESTFVAGIAADALSMIGGEVAVRALVERLVDENTHARLLAVRALGRIKSQSAIGPLFGALEDPSYLVRYYAQEALEALGVGMVFVAP